MDPALDSQDLERLVTEFTERVPEVLHVLVASSDGVLLAGCGRMRPDQLEQLSVIASGLVSLADAASRVFDGGAVIQALVTMERGTFVMMTIDDRSSLAVLATAAADLDLVAYEMTMLARRAGGIAVTSAAPEARHEPG